MGTLRRLKRLAGMEPAETGAYVCEGCGSSFDVQYHVCPVCGGFSVNLRPADDEDD